MCVCVCVSSLYMCMLSLFSHVHSLWHYGPYPPGSSVHGIPGKNTGVGWCALLQGIFSIQGSKPRLLCVLHWQAGSLLLAPPGSPPPSHICNCVCSVVPDSLQPDPKDCSPLGSSVHGIFQTRTLKWVAIASSRDIPIPGIEPATPVSAGRLFTTELPGKLIQTYIYVYERNQYWGMCVYIHINSIYCKE